MSEEIKKLFTGEIYTGETSGAGGARYYILKEIAEHNDAEILVRDSEIGGAENRCLFTGDLIKILKTRFIETIFISPPLFRDGLAFLISLIFQKIPDKFKIVTLI